ncbi:uncharacterized protein N0V89_000566 [Didymosphaeria variabile]|uniref:Subtilisin-like protein n=1 Tax=Didymosphaeria variabile TaxID=1932322 RepID=A0A9W8XUH8_9PLEO|nr:uncharacterized protein N0V89_000566 [Didymosphaeria variabile]KAJ4360007.1 hypothetical protein N0V89_000566 [Didymosphaeria variabile]
MRAIVPLEIKKSSSYLVALKDGVGFQQSLLSEIKKATGVSASLTTNLSGGQIFKGVIIELSIEVEIPTAIDKIKELSDIVSVMPNEQLEPPKLDLSNVIESPESITNATVSHGQTSLTAAQMKQLYSNDQIMMQVDTLREKGITGKGIKVALVDAKADTTHPGIKIAFSTDLRDSDDRHGDPMCGSHATACAGLISSVPSIAAEWQGVAPDVELGNYIISGCKGGTVGKIMQALEQAAIDKVNVVSLSLGWGSYWAFTAFSSEVRLFEKIAAKGILLVVSAGNDGNKGLYKEKISCTSPSNLCVGMVENTHNVAWNNTASYALDDGTVGKMKWRNGNSGSGMYGWTNVSLPLWINPTLGGWAGNGADGCAEYPANTPDLSRHIVLVRRGECGGDELIIQKAGAHGAKYVLLSDFTGAVDRLNDINVNVPNVTAVAFLPGNEAQNLVTLLQSGRNITINISGIASYSSSPKGEGIGGRIERQSSWGPTLDGSTGVGIAAPGTEMPLLVPGGKFGFGGGTSFATPVVAGAVALVAQALNTTDMARVANVLTSTTKFLDRDAGGGWGPGYASTAQQGAGMIQVDRAASATAYVNARNLEFNQTNYRTSKNVDIVNIGDKALEFEVLNVPAGTVNSLRETHWSGPLAFEPITNYDDIYNKGYVQPGATLQFSSTKVTVPAKGKATIQVTAIDPKDPGADLLPIWSGWVLFKAADGFNLSLPYLGFKGDLDRSPKVWRVEAQKKAVNFPSETQGIIWFRGMGSHWIRTYLHYAGNGTRAWPVPIWDDGEQADGGIVGTGWFGDLKLNPGSTRVSAGEYFFRTDSLRGFAERNGPTTADDLVHIDSEPFAVAWSN